MNVELRRRTTEWVPAPSAANARAANDNSAPSRAPAQPRALIYRPARSAMTSGPAGMRRWVLEFEPQAPPFIEPLMGWIGSTDPLAGMRLGFPSREAAVGFAERQGIAYEVQDPAPAPGPRAEAPRQAARTPYASAPPAPSLDLPRWDWSGLLLPEPVPDAGTAGPSPGLAA